MRRIDELFTAWPFLGSRRMTAMLKAEGPQVNRKHVQRLMRKMGIAALGPRPNTTRPAPGHKDLSLSVAQRDDHPAKPGVGGSSNPNRTLSRRTGIGSVHVSDGGSSNKTVDVIKFHWPRCRPDQPLQSFAVGRADRNLLDLPHRRREGAGSR